MGTALVQTGFGGSPRPLLVLAFLCEVKAFLRFATELPNGGKVPDPDRTGEFCRGWGHTSCFGGGPRNTFGLDFKNHGLQWTKDLCTKDSDGDGQTNGQELGDPCCQWSKGNPLPLPETLVSHPGRSDSTLDRPAALTDCADAAGARNTSESTPPGSSVIPHQRTHGILMAVAWVLLAPAGAAVARLIPALGMACFYAHVLLQASALVLTVAGTALIVAKQSLPAAWVTWEGLPYSHGRVGIIVLALALAQPINGAIRPHPGTGAWRRVWEAVHGVTGRAAVALGVFNCFLGIYVYTELNLGISSAWVPWVALCVLSLGLINMSQFGAEKLLKWRSEDGAGKADQGEGADSHGPNGKEEGSHGSLNPRL
mmetsp:Transcript_35018/g.83031  ORF Transcript_35018/g.83031 Transcript_35018/m.83031 type:complete len:369 (-) Transcript_35018:765-1871(-)